MATNLDSTVLMRQGEDQFISKESGVSNRENHIYNMENKPATTLANSNVQLGIQRLTPQSHSTPRQIVDRKSLQTLQHSATGKGQLNGGKHSKQHDATVIKSTQGSPYMISPKGVKIYHDSDNSSSSRVHCSRDIQTDESLLEDLLQERLLQGVGCEDDSGLQTASQDTLDLLVSEIPSENYWKDLAEERRRALKETLVENERLSIEVEKLKEENARLIKVEQRAEELQKLLEDILPDEEDEGTASQLEGESSTSQGDDPDLTPPVTES